MSSLSSSVFIKLNSNFFSMQRTLPFFFYTYNTINFRDPVLNRISSGYEDIFIDSIIWLREKMLSYWEHLNLFHSN